MRYRSEAIRHTFILPIPCSATIRRRDSPRLPAFCPSVSSPPRGMTRDPESGEWGVRASPDQAKGLVALAWKHDPKVVEAQALRYSASKKEEKVMQLPTPEVAQVSGATERAGVVG